MKNSFIKFDDGLYKIKILSRTEISLHKTTHSHYWKRSYTPIQ